MKELTVKDEAPRRGRPPASEPGSTISVWVPTTTHDRIVRLAAKSDQSVSSVVRQMLRLRLPSDSA